MSGLHGSVKEQALVLSALPPPGRVTLAKPTQHRHEPLILTCVCLGEAGGRSWDLDIRIKWPHKVQGPGDAET